MKNINLLCLYYLHGLDGSQEDFQRFKGKVEETFQDLFQKGNEDPTTSTTLNYTFGYCSKENAHTKSRSELSVLVERSFQELQHFLETEVLSRVGKDPQLPLPHNKNNDKNNDLNNNDITNIHSNNDHNNCNHSNHNSNDKNNSKDANTNPTPNDDNKAIHYTLYFSIVGHSLGGLILKGVVRQIYALFTSADGQKVYPTYFDYLTQNYTFLKAVKPCSLMTLSTPHLGTVIGDGDGGWIQRLMKMGTRIFCNFLSGSIGKTFIYKDARPPQRPGLIQLGEEDALKAYAHFPHRSLLGCLRYDVSVKFASAMGHLDQPVQEFEGKHLLVEKNKVDTRLCSYSGFAEEDKAEGGEGGGEKKRLFYQREVLNEQVSKNFYYADTEERSLPDLDSQIQKALDALPPKKKKKAGKGQPTSPPEKYEKMDDVFIPDTIRQIETAVSAVKLFNGLSYRRFAIDFCLPGYARVTTHPVYMGFIVGRSTPVIEEMVNRTVQFFTNLLLADYLWTSQQHTSYSLTDLYPPESDSEADSEAESQAKTLAEEEEV